MINIITRHIFCSFAKISQKFVEKTSFRKPKQVYKALKLYKKYGINVGRGKNKYSSKCEEIIKETKEKLKR